jgi:hypothetical protein
MTNELPPLPEWSKCDDLGGLVPSEIRTALREYARAAVEAEREACAHVCEAFAGLGYRDDGSDAWMGHDNAVQACAAAIRARGEA